MQKVDKNFYDRADEHINLSNSQLEHISKGKVSASMMYAVARFNAWISACEYQNKEEMKSGKKDLIEYFVTQYEKMLEENLDDYINNFDEYMKST